MDMRLKRDSRVTPKAPHPSLRENKAQKLSLNKIRAKYSLKTRNKMNYAAMLNADKASKITLSADEKNVLLTRGAVSNIPLMAGDIIYFPENVAITFRDVLGTKIAMVVGAKLATAETEFNAETCDGVQLGAMAFGRCVTNQQTKVTITPKTVADESGKEYDAEKLLFNAIQSATIGEMPKYIAGKKFQILASESVELVNPDGSARLNNTGQPIFQTVYAFVEI